MKASKTRYKLSRIIFLVLVQHILLSQAIYNNLTPIEFFSEIYNSYKEDLKSIWHEIDANVFYKRHSSLAQQKITNSIDDIEPEQEFRQQNYNLILEKEEVGKKKLGFTNVFQSTQSFMQTIGQKEKDQKVGQQNKAQFLNQILNEAAEKTANKIMVRQEEYKQSQTPNYDHLSYEQLLKKYAETNNPNQAEEQQPQQLFETGKGKNKKYKPSGLSSIDDFWNQITTLQKKADDATESQAKFINGVLGSDGESYQHHTKKKNNKSAKMLHQVSSKSKLNKPIEITHNESEEKDQAKAQKKDEPKKEEKKEEPKKEEQKKEEPKKEEPKKEEQKKEEPKKDEQKKEDKKIESSSKIQNKEQKVQEKPSSDQKEAQPQKNSKKEVIEDSSEEDLERRDLRKQIIDFQSQLSKKPGDVLARLQGYHNDKEGSQMKITHNEDQEEEEEEPQAKHLNKVQKHKSQNVPEFKEESFQKQQQPKAQDSKKLQSHKVETEKQFENPLEQSKVEPKNHHKNHSKPKELVHAKHHHQHKEAKMSKEKFGADEEQEDKEEKPQKLTRTKHSKMHQEVKSQNVGQNLKDLTEKLIKQNHNLSHKHHNQKHNHDLESDNSEEEDAPQTNLSQKVRGRKHGSKKLHHHHHRH